MPIDSIQSTVPRQQIFWPPDSSWFIYTDWDLMATRISGSQTLSSRLNRDGLSSEPELEIQTYRLNLVSIWQTMGFPIDESPVGDCVGRPIDS
jgi:hypothetical protein